METRGVLRQPPASIEANNSRIPPIRADTVSKVVATKRYVFRKKSFETLNLDGSPVTLRIVYAFIHYDRRYSLILGSVDDPKIRNEGFNSYTDILMYDNHELVTYPKVVTELIKL